MANPTKPKDAKPKAEGEEDFSIKPTSAPSSQPSSGSSLITTIAVVAIAAVVIIVTNYILVDMKLAQMSNKIASLTTTEEDAGDGEENVSAERGIILDLGEFILNLSDTGSRRFLKVNVAVELSKKPSDEEAAKGGGGHGESKDATSKIESEMEQFKPSIRDSIISVLSAKTSEELNTTTGKELAKEQIKESIDAVFEGDREVLRVSFGSFFIQ